MPHVLRTISNGPSSASVVRTQAKNPTSNPPIPAWQNLRQSNLLKRALSNASATSAKAPRFENSNDTQSPGPSQFSQMNIANTPSPNPPSSGARAGGIINPSAAPTPSAVTNNSQAGNQTPIGMAPRSGTRGYYNKVATLSGYTWRDFRRGDVVGVPFHEPNTNPNLAPDDEHLRWTCAGTVYTKRRLVVVLWVYKRDMFCVPLYTFNHTGLRNKQHTLEEYVAMQNWDDTDSHYEGLYPPVVVQTRRNPIDKMSTIHLAGGFKVACDADISKCGRVTEESYTHLVDIWEKLSNDAKDQAW